MFNLYLSVYHKDRETGKYVIMMLEDIDAGKGHSLPHCLATISQ